MFPSLAAFSAVIAKSSTYLRLSVLMLLFTCLFASVYSACALAFSALVRLILIAAFLFLLSSILSSVPTVIHSLWWCFFWPRTSWHVETIASLIPFQLLSMVVPSPLSRSWKAWNLLLRAMLNSLSLSASRRKAVLNFCDVVRAIVQCFLSFSFILATSKWWSDAISAPLLVLTSSIVLLNFLLMQIWSIWFCVVWSGEIQVALCMFLCGNMVPPMTSLLKAHRFANLSPFSFLSPSPCCPMTSSYPVLSFPTLALKSPIRMVRSLVGHFSKIDCSLS